MRSVLEVSTTLRRRHLQQRYVVYHFLSLNFSQLGVTGHKMLEREVAILKRVQHPHIVALEEVFETSAETS